MSQSAIFGNAALRSTDPFAPVREPQVDPAIFERLPITPAEPFEAPRLRLVAGDAAGSASATRAANRPKAHPARLRLTHRGRVVVVVFVALITTLLLFAVGLAPSQASTGAASGATSAGAPTGSSVVVQPGETLWSIATRVAPNTDPRGEVDALIAANHLKGAAISAGQVLVLP